MLSTETLRMRVSPELLLASKEKDEDIVLAEHNVIRISQACEELRKRTLPYAFTRKKRGK